MTATIERATPVVRKLPGRGVLVRHGDLVLLCEPANGQHPRLGELLAALATAAESPAGAREMSRLLGGLLSGARPSEFPPLCAFGPAEDGLVAIVYGQAALTLVTVGGEMRLDGREAVTVVDRIITEPVVSVRASVGRGGAAALEMDWLGAGAAAPAVEEPPPPARPATRGRKTKAVAPPPEPEPTPAVVPDEPAPTPVAVEIQARPNGTQVIGVSCKDGHFNDPKMPYCAVCGISMTGSNRQLVVGSRPQLGVLVVDDGTVSPLVHDHVVGHRPEMDEAVAGGRASPVRLIDPLVSAVHARVVLDGWDVRVVDAGSAIGTFVCGPGESAWTQLSQGESAVLQPGTVVAFGRRQLCYHTYRNLANHSSGHNGRSNDGQR